MNWYFEVLKKYATFTGRARRKEYWFYNLVNFIIMVLLGGLDEVLQTDGGLGAIYILATFLPSLAVSVRRLHDTGRSGWWMLISLVPFIGFIVLLIFMCIETQTGSNKYGVDSKLADNT